MISPDKQWIADGYDAITEKVGLDMHFYDRCLAMHSNYQTANVLDIGCGRGFLLQKLRVVAPQAKLSGLDISPKLCEIARANVLTADIAQGDAESLPYADDSFDIVFMTEALEHMLDYDKALSEVRRVLRPNGVFIVTVPNRDWVSYDFYDQKRNHALQPIDDHYFTVPEIRGYLEHNSFNIVKYRGSDCLYYYEPYHKYEQALAFFVPALHLKMKRIILKCVNTKTAA